MNSGKPRTEQAEVRHRLLQSHTTRYAVAIVAVILAGLLRYFLSGFFSERAAYITFYPAVTIAAVLGGFGPGVVATCLATWVAAYWILPPVGQLMVTSTVDQISLAMFAALGCFISVVAGLYHRSHDRAAVVEKELALRESETRYRELVENANSAIIRWKRDGTITFFNEYAQAFFGYSADEAVGKSVGIIVPETGSTGVDLTTLLQNIVSHPEDYANNVNENVCRDGRRVWVAWTNKPILDESGQVAEMLAVGSDITKLKRAEEALEHARYELELRVQERTAELREAQNRLVEQSRILEGFFTSTITPLVLLDRDFNFIRVNEAYARSCKKEIGEFPGHNHFEFFPDEENEAIFRSVVETKVPHQAIAKPFVFPDHPEWGATYWNWTLTPLVNKSGEVEFLVFSLQDVTEQIRTEQQLRHAQKMEALGTLTGGIAHDFNNILAAMIGFTELARSRVTEGSREEHHLQRVFDAGLRGRELVRQMLTFSRKVEEERKPLRLSSIVEESVKLLRASIPTTIDVRVNNESESGFILGDPVQIQQVLMNLATNAAYAMRENGGALDIELTDFSVSASNGNPHGIEPGLYMKLTVRDTGTGMSPDISDKIFDPFFTTKPVGEGTGLGLAVAHGIIERSNGHITVESEPGKGSTFTVYFPKVAGGPPSDAVSDETLPTGAERILFVDDEESLVEVGEEILAELGYEVMSQTSSAEALALLRDDPSRFDVVITDQTMPELTGLELAKEILAIRPDLPVILCTGFSHTVDADSAKAAGIKAYLMKPLTKRELAKTIRKVLDG